MRNWETTQALGSNWISRMGAFLNVAAKNIYEISQGAKAQGTRQVICKITFVNFSLTSRKWYFLAQFIAIVDNALNSGHPGGGGEADYPGDILGYGVGFVNF